jgi:cysteine sulfinate desulfinase/cysteine desulfurase-like protein
MTAFGLSPDEADSTVRISISSKNTMDECEILVSALENGVKSLVKKTYRK